MKERIKTYAVSILISLGVGGLSAFLTRNNMQIYEGLNQPLLAPPGILFPIVWSVLYILMGVGAAMIYEKGGGNRERALFVYGLQLAVNFFWSIIFFNMQAYLFAFIWLLLLLALIIVMIYQFSKSSKLAAWLQVPYLLWVCFAGYLTIMIYLLN